MGLLRKTAIAALLSSALLSAPAVQAMSGSGSYLAGRQAALDRDFGAAAGYFTRALIADPSNPQLLEQAALANLAMGSLDRALPIARTIEEMGLQSQIAHMIVVAGLVKAGDWDGLLARDAQTVGVGPLVDGLVTAWAHLGAGDVAEALAAFDKVAERGGLRGFALYHKAMALAMMGDYESAEAIFSDEASGAALMMRRGTMARAEILSQLERNDRALEMLTQAFGTDPDPGLTQLMDRLAAGENLPFSHVTSVQDGVAEVFFSVAAALTNEARDEYTLIYGRVATYLRPDHVDAILLNAQLLDGLEQYDMAVETYRSVPTTSPDFHAAELGRAEALRRAGKPDAAIEVLDRLASDYPDLAEIHSALGDIYRQQDNFAAAITAYDRALELTEEGARSEWFLHYVRGISHERLDQWDQAEADFRAALALNPEQPQVLNYLGYSLVEKQIKLDEALDMIQRAVAARPDSGYIVDSLGWVLFRLGRYDEAVGHMERAVELMPVDPVVTDHLGDVYWAVGRYREAEFQWKRALSFIDPEDTENEADPERIRRKLEVGLDQVLVEEGAPPLKIANDNGG
ncbi:MAG: tetratricopeptide repeat protein [Rhodobacteraceae bacterium]|nr:MAG: tetratricopeptide repeat protein [Paracoccaceae bacterium]